MDRDELLFIATSAGLAGTLGALASLLLDDRRGWLLAPLALLALILLWQQAASAVPTEAASLPSASPATPPQVGAESGRVELAWRYGSPAVTALLPGRPECRVGLHPESSPDSLVRSLRLELSTPAGVRKVRLLPPVGALDVGETDGASRATIEPGVVVGMVAPGLPTVVRARVRRVEVFVDDPDAFRRVHLDLESEPIAS